MINHNTCLIDGLPKVTDTKDHDEWEASDRRRALHRWMIENTVLINPEGGNE